ncbi:MAG: Rieske (2Fe-2S) protein [Pirellulales bacterium]
MSIYPQVSGALMHTPPTDAVDDVDSPDDRRRFLRRSASVAMAAGLAASYGTMAVYAGRFLYTVQDDHAWLFVTDVASLPPGGSIPFESPTGVRVTVVRRAAQVGAAEARAEDFAALSSVCPHLGCRVHWEPQNGRYFCPCHNGAFDAEGKATEGPPAAAGQELPRYPVRVDRGLVFLEMPLNAVGVDRNVFLKT